MTESPNHLSIVDARKKLLSGHTTALGLAKEVLETIENRDKEINAFLEVYDDVLESAKQADRKLAKDKEKTPILTGIPIALKDNILVQGKRASAASKMLENYVASYDATVTKKLKEAGAVFVGRTNMDEFAMGASTESSAFGITKNPIDPSRVPGGSSGGSAAAVAMGGAVAALGSDTGGSIRQPASFCGLVGLKPTYGAVSRYGLIAMGSSLDQIGPIGKTVADVELLFSIIAGEDSMDSTSKRGFKFQKGIQKPHRIGVPRHILEGGLDTDIKELFERALEPLSKKGYELVDIELASIQYALPTYYIIMPAEASSNLARFDGVKYGLHVEGNDLLGDYVKTRYEGFGDEVRRRIILGTYVLSAGYYDAYYGKALSVRNQITNDFKKAFKSVDVIAMPTAPSPAFKIGEKSNDPLSMYLADIFTVPANLTGMPAMSVPAGEVKRDGVHLPVGLQITAPHFCENRLFSLGKELEA